MSFKHCKTEESVKSAFRDTFFSKYCYSPSKIDVVIRPPNDSPLHHQVTTLWAESKLKTSVELDKALVQLFLTIGKEGANADYTPPPYIAAFNPVKIVFLPYDCIADLFLESAHINFSCTPSDYESEAFKEAHRRLAPIISKNKITYEFDAHEEELQKFIKDNILKQQTGKQMEITKNNLIAVCSRWRKEVMPTINVSWDKIRKQSKYAFVESDMFMADLLSSDNKTIIPELKVKLESSHYIQKEKAEDALTDFYVQEIGFTDGMKAHNEFWKRYKRPPEDEMVKWVMARKDLLQPQTVRERKGSFFTPQIWVQKSQEALVEVLGEEWQNEYYIWDCCAGTGNMEVGLINKNNIFASTIDEGDVAIMHELFHTSSKDDARLFADHVFQFDFLNDPFFDETDDYGNVKTSKLPPALQDILRDPEKRKKLVIYINPPYVEAANKQTVIGTGNNKTNVAVQTVIYKECKDQIGVAGRELSAQFIYRIYKEIRGCILADFSKLKGLQGPNFEKFRNFFQAKLKSLFIVPADTFDNVKGKFPIGFFIWDTKTEEAFSSVVADVYNADEEWICKKEISKAETTINDWLISTRKRQGETKIAFMSVKGADFQTVNYNFIINDKKLLPHPRGSWITDKNLIESSIYLAVRHCIEATWLNDRDQFLYPNDGWKTDREFQTDCLAFTLFNGQNNIMSGYGVNHWIPFTEDQVGSSQSFDSRFMSDFIAGKIKHDGDNDFFKDGNDYIPREKIVFSPEAQAVMDAGLEIWRYYFQAKNHLATFNRNASFYDIRKVFQGENAQGKMNPISDDGFYNDLHKTLRKAQKKLASKIARKVYEYEFLK